MTEERVEGPLEARVSVLRDKLRHPPKTPGADYYGAIVEIIDRCLYGYKLAAETHGAAYRNCGLHVVEAVEDGAQAVLDAPREASNPVFRNAVQEYADEARTIYLVLLAKRRGEVPEAFVPEPIRRRISSGIWD